MSMPAYQPDEKYIKSVESLSTLKPSRKKLIVGACVLYIVVSMVVIIYILSGKQHNIMATCPIQASVLVHSQPTHQERTVKASPFSFFSTFPSCISKHFTGPIRDARSARIFTTLKQDVDFRVVKEIALTPQQVDYYEHVEPGKITPRAEDIICTEPRQDSLVELTNKCKTQPKRNFKLGGYCTKRKCLHNKSNLKSITKILDYRVGTCLGR